MPKRHNRRIHFGSKKRPKIQIRLLELWLKNLSLINHFKCKVCSNSENRVARCKFWAHVVNNLLIYFVVPYTFIWVTINSIVDANFSSRELVLQKVIWISPPPVIRSNFCYSGDVGKTGTSWKLFSQKLSKKSEFDNTSRPKWKFAFLSHVWSTRASRAELQTDE